METVINFFGAIKYFFFQFKVQPAGESSSLDGLYYSNVTGRIFEANRIDDQVIIFYADGKANGIKDISVGIFYLQLDLEFYESLAIYNE